MQSRLPYPMKTVEQRVWRGPNRYASKPCVQTLVDLGDLACAVTSSLPGLDKALLALFPGMRDFTGPLARGCLVAEVIGRVALELQRLAGAAPDIPFSTFVQCRQARATIIVAYQIEHVAVTAIGRALHIVAALCESGQGRTVRRKKPKAPFLTAPAQRIPSQAPEIRA